MNLYAVILAAGCGKRMNSLRPKVLHEVLGMPMLQYVVDAVKTLAPRRIIIVVGNASEEIKKRINAKGVSFIIQKRPLGTGNALAEARRVLGNVKNATIVVLNGDSPLITAKTLKELLKKHKHDKNDLSFLSFTDDSALGYGRVLRAEDSKVMGIVEDKHATQEYKKVKELNGGVYAMQPEILDYLGMLKRHSSSGEYYLTDIVSIASGFDKKINAYNCPSEEIRGVNNREELHQVSDILNKRIISKWMKKGVTFIAPQMSFIQPLVSIGKDTIIYPNTYLEGNTSIGEGCIIHSGVRICNSVIGKGVVIKDCTLIENSKIRDMSIIGPFAYLKNS